MEKFFRKLCLISFIFGILGILSVYYVSELKYSNLIAWQFKSLLMGIYIVFPISLLFYVKKHIITH